MTMYIVYTRPRLDKVPLNVDGLLMQQLPFDVFTIMSTFYDNKYICILTKERVLPCQLLAQTKNCKYRPIGFCMCVIG